MLLLAIAVTWGVFEAMPHLEDEHTYLFQAKLFASGRVTVDAPLNPCSFYIPHVINTAGKRFSKDFPGYPLVLSLGVLIGQPWVVNAFAAVVTLMGVYLFGRDIFDHDTGLLAAAFGAISPLFIQLASSFNSNATSIAVLIFFGWTFMRTRREQSSRQFSYGVIAGGLLGWAAITRPLTSVAIGLPFAVLALADLIRRKREVVGRYFVMAGAFMAILSILPLYNFIATGSPITNTYQMYWPYDSIGFGFQFGPEDDGHWITDAILNTRIALNKFGGVFLGWPILAGWQLSWIPVLLGLVYWPYTKRAWGLMVPPLVLVLAYMTYWAASAARYYAESMPFLWIVAAHGLIKFTANRWTKKIVTLVLPLLMAWGIITVTYPVLAERRELFNISRRDANIISTANLHHALIFVWNNYWTDYANLSWLNSPDLNGDIVFVKNCSLVENSQIINNYPGRAVYFYNRNQEPPLIPFKKPWQIWEENKK